MNVNEAHDLLEQHEKDLAAEQDPEVRAWYRLESELQPDIMLARRTMAEVEAVANLIGHVANLKGNQADTAENTGISPEEVETSVQSEILTPEELLTKRIERRYAACLRDYQMEINNISTTKKSKREHLEKMARRNFARKFNDFNDVSGDSHIALRIDLLRIASDSIIDDEMLFDEVFANCADYAKRNAVEVTATPRNFAELLAESTEGRPYTKVFEEILKGIFASDPSDFTEIYFNLARAAFEILDDYDALKTIVEIIHLDKAYVPGAFITAPDGSLEEAISAGDTTSFIDLMECGTVLRAVVYDITGLNKPTTSRLRELYNSYRPDYAMLEQTRSSVVEELESIIDTSTESKGAGISYDPVEIADLNGENPVYLRLKPVSEEARESLAKSVLFSKRMQELAPFNYSIRAAKKIFNGGAHANTLVLSPSVTMDVFLPLRAGQVSPAPELLDKLRESIESFMPVALSTAANSKELGVSSYGDSGVLRMRYMPLYENEKDGIIVIRPAVSLDKRIHSAIDQLHVNYASIKSHDEMLGEAHPEAETFQAESKNLRTAIKSEQKRFLGRRPVRFPMPSRIRQTGLGSISLRYEPKLNQVKALFELHDGEVELTLDRNFNIDTTDSRSGRPYHDTDNDRIKLYYENLILKLAQKWTCGQEVSTSEGVVSEWSGNSANMGHYAYLRIREDGRRYQFSETQRLACLEEQGRDLVAESERLKLLDSTGKMRNSTYVRENYDPAKPPLEVYYSDLA